MATQRTFSNMFKKRNNRIIAQVVFWSLLICSMNLSFLDLWSTPEFLFKTILPAIAITLLILWNVLGLIPRFFHQKQYGKYIFSTIITVIVVVVLFNLLENFFMGVFSDVFQSGRPGQGPRFGPPRPKFPHLDPKVFMQTIIYTATIMLGTVFESIELQNQQEQRTQLLEKEKLETEMKFLKSQINPHFLFNALNNVYTLTLIQSEEAPEMVMGLSEMLRYMLYESNQEVVPLEKEINYIENYIALVQLKGEKPLDVDVSIDVKHQTAGIAPLILIPFIENAFKHSKIEDIKTGWVKVNLKEENGFLLFNVSNSLVKHQYTKDATGGIGLQNVKRRLELQYPEHHSLDIKQNETQFEVNLSIKLR